MGTYTHKNHIGSLSHLKLYNYLCMYYYFVMNHFTRLSIELANRQDYVDQLFQVYPLSPDHMRSISPELWDEILQGYNGNDNVALFKSLLKLDLFPIKDSYVPFFRHNKSAILRNPQTINRICGRVRELGLDRLYERITEPKETNRQIGPMFRRWIESGALGVLPCDEDEFCSSDVDAVLRGPDARLKDFAVEHLGFKRADDKGLDFIGRFNNVYVVGEAKFLTDEGGHQNGQFLDAMTTLKAPVNDNVVKVAILDGVLYKPGKKKMYTAITTQDVNVMSALLLKDFLYNLHE